MPSRSVTIEGKRWNAYPSGFVTQYDRDEFGVLFVAGAGDGREVRVARYSPHGSRFRESSFAEMSEERLVELFRQSQPGDTSPEAGYVL